MTQKTLLQLHQFYRERMEPDLRQLEEQRIRTAKLFVIEIVAGLAVFPAATAIIGLLRASLSVAVSVGLVTAIAVAYAISIGSRRCNYRSQFKKRVILPLIDFIYPGLSYDPMGMVESHRFRQSQIFSQYPDRYKGDDLITGMIGETRIAFSEVLAHSCTGDESTTIFRGLFFVADFNKCLRGETLILPDRAERLLGRLGQKLQERYFSSHNLVTLEDPSFERLFAVYGDNEIEARYILTPSLMKRIVRFRRRTKREVFLSFIRDRVHVAIPCEKTMFEPRLFRTLLDFSQIEEYFYDLQLVIGIVEDLNLNTRIWTKVTGAEHAK